MFITQQYPALLISLSLSVNVFASSHYIHTHTQTHTQTRTHKEILTGKGIGVRSGCGCCCCCGGGGCSSCCGCGCCGCSGEPSGRIGALHVGHFCFISNHRFKQRMWKQCEQGSLCACVHHTYQKKSHTYIHTYHMRHQSTQSIIIQWQKLILVRINHNVNH